jgi:disulfide bond formation protein DsbB
LAPDTLLSPNRSGLVVALASALTLGAVFVAQYGFGLAPCELCIAQRWPHAAAVVLGIAALLLPRLRVALLALAGIALAVGDGIAVYHAGVEWHWWQGPTACTGSGTPDSIEALRAQLLTAQVVRCDEVAFRFLGLSMAGWNVLWSALLVVFAGLAAKRAAAK